MVSQPRSVQSSRWDGAIFLIIPGTSCLATIVMSLRDKKHSTAEVLLQLAFMGETLGHGGCRDRPYSRKIQPITTGTLRKGQVKNRFPFFPPPWPPCENSPDARRALRQSQLSAETKNRVQRGRGKGHHAAARTVTFKVQSDPRPGADTSFPLCRCFRSHFPGNFQERPDLFNGRFSSDPVFLS
jgi:hypothetical protein